MVSLQSVLLVLSGAMGADDGDPTDPCIPQRPLPDGQVPCWTPC
jgi:hypothetical protein